MDKDNKYYNLIEKLIRNHRKFAGYEPILEDIIDDVYAHSEAVLNSIRNESVIEAYIEKVVSTSIITVPKRLNFNNERRRRKNDSVSNANSAIYITQENKTIEESNQLADYKISEEIGTVIQADNSKDNIKKANNEFVDKMINSITADSIDNSFERTSEENGNTVNSEFEELSSLLEEDGIQEQEELPVDDTFAQKNEEENLESNIDIADESIELEEQEELPVDDTFAQINEEENLESNIDIADESIELEEQEELPVNDAFAQINEEENLESNIDIIDESVENIEEADNNELSLTDEFSPNEDTDILESLTDLHEQNSSTNNDNELLIAAEPDSEVENEISEFCVERSNDSLLSNEEDSALLSLEDNLIEDFDANIEINNDNISETFDIQEDSDFLLTEEEFSDNDEKVAGIDAINSGEAAFSDLEKSLLEETSNEPLQINELQNISVLNTEELNEQNIISEGEESNSALNCEENEIESSNLVHKKTDYSVFNYSPIQKEEGVDTNEVLKKIKKLDKENPSLNILKIFDLKYKQNATVSQIAEHLNISKQDVILALEELVDLI